MSKAPLYVAGTIFGLIALIHLYRLYSHFSIIIGTTEVPSWVNVVAAVVAGGLSYWMFSSACPKCCK
jgi:hypothetical protein